MNVWNLIVCVKCIKELIVLSLLLRSMDSSCRTLAFRCSIVVGLATAVATILYFTPLPDQYPQSCSRPCHELDWPLICRVKLTFERYQSLGGPCRNCPVNVSSCYHENCITVDGQAKGILTANRQFPGPTLQVCQHDIIVVDVVNRIPGQSFGIHWRGQPQSETPYMDGVPMITQCPIPSLTTFQYKFRASEAGTHMWQVNTGDENLETLFGPFIVRKPESKETHRKLYDTDDMNNVVVIHSWNPRKSNFLYQDDPTPIKLLINGKTQENGMPPSVFYVSPGKRHRFRVVYQGGAKACQVRLFIENHEILVIALDGRPIKPKMVTSVRLFPGERVDFVLRADQKIAPFYMRVVPVETCRSLLPTHAVVEYNGSRKDASEAGFGVQTSKQPIDFTELKTFTDEDCRTSNKNSVNMCLNDIRSTQPLPMELSRDTTDVKFYFFYNLAMRSNQDIVNTTFIALSETVAVPQTNNLTMMLPPSPLLSQAEQISSSYFCNNESLPERCQNNLGDICECVHLVEIPLNAVVELVLVNLDKSDHIFHLHGYSFYVIGGTKLPSLSMKPEKIKYLDKTNQLVWRNFDYPVEKDTVAVVNNSAVVLRFKADNPGYWLLDEEQSSHWSRGMSLILHVGKKSDLSPIPKNFPKCGDWIGPEFFLV